MISISNLGLLLVVSFQIKKLPRVVYGYQIVTKSGVQVTHPLFLFTKQNTTDTVERLRNSLGEILVHYYLVAGRLSLAESGRIEVDCNAKGVRLFEAQTTTSFANYDFSPSESVKELVPKIDYTQSIEEIPLLFVKLTRFHGGQGFFYWRGFQSPFVLCAWLLSIHEFMGKAGSRRDTRAT
ncbi:unnamed protein product [Sphenostylis stenocarpa]|uniref:Uncharacterized protein n=1 Tax=Sphenostylis stenocarpa TaxID=92480 RepID=A0AA86T2T7_9FABA|nr:unnamed protein product [Sphenostylis stenocarpa]